MEDRNGSGLERGLEINEEIAAAHQIHLGKRRIVQNIVLGKDAAVPNGFADAVACVGAIEESAQALRRNIPLNIIRIAAAASLDDAGFAYVGSKELKRSFRSFVAEEFQKGNRNRIGFLAGSAAGRPDPNRRFGRSIFQKLRKNFGLQSVKNARIAEEAGYIDQQVLIESIWLSRRLLNEFQVVAQTIHPVDHHSPVDSSQNRGLSVMSEVHSGGFPQELKNTVQARVQA